MKTRQCPKAIHLALLAVLCLRVSTPAAPWEDSAWRGTTYYRADFAADADADALLHVAAADSYAVYFNGGEPVGGDSVGTRMLTFPVAVSGASAGNQIAVKVVNRGRGLGSGLVAALVGEDLRLETSTNQKVQTWYWTTEEPDDSGWLTADVSRDDSWQVVQQGAMDVSQIENMLAPAIEVIAGFPSGIDLGSREGSLILKQIRGQNLALDMPATRPEVVDGNVGSSWDPPTNALNFAASIDLQVRRNIHTVRVLTRGTNPAQLEENSLRGYSVQASDDQIRWTEVGVIHDITRFDWTEVTFTPVWTRYLRIVIVDINPVAAPKVGEIEIYGDGFTDEAVYLSELKSLGSADSLKNFGRVHWDAEVPQRTDLTVQFRTGNSAADFEDPDRGWSEPLEERDMWFPAAEPRRLLQYRVTMRSRDDRRTPEFKGIGGDYSGEIAVSGSRGHVVPNMARMGADTLFTYTLDLDFSEEDVGIERVRIAVPSEAELAAGDELAAVLADWHSTQSTLELVFSEPLRDVEQLVIPFVARSYANVHRFRADLHSPGSENPLNVAEADGEDPVTGEALSWSVVTTTSTEAALSAVRADPAVFTPNGDGVNDDTVIEFVLSKIDAPRPVRVRIYDLSGVLARDLNPDNLVAGTYLGGGGRGARPDAPGYWDGTDDQGSLVPPGIYLFRIEAEVDTGDEVASGIINVAY